MHINFTSLSIVHNCTLYTLFTCTLKKEAASYTLSQIITIHKIQISHPANDCI